MKNILVIKLRYIGDVLLATPVLRALRDQFPEARVTILVNRGTEDIVKWNPDLNEVLVVDRRGAGEQVRFVRDIRCRRFECVIDLTDGDRSAIVTWMTGAPMRIGFNEERRWRGLLYSHVVATGSDRIHRVERDLEALRPLGVEPKAGPLVLHTSSEDEEVAARLLQDLGFEQSSGDTRRPLVLLHPGARYWFKAWPAERFAELADCLADAFGCRVLVGGDAGDREVAEAIRARARSAPAVLAGRTTLLQLAAVLKRCALFIGNDNGPMHMASAMGTPVVALFGPSNPAQWGPRGGKVKVIYKELDCRQCFHLTCYRGNQSCMKLITVEEVFQAARRLLV